MKHIYRNVILCLLLGTTLIGCNKKVTDPKPTVTVMTEEGFTTGNSHLFTGSTLKFGFDAKANAETNEKLVKFQMRVSNGKTDIYDTVFVLNNEDSFHAEGEFTFTELGNWQIVGRAFDAANEQGSAYIDIHVLEDMETTFTWKQVGYGIVEGFDDYGLIWKDSIIVNDSITVALDTICLQPANDSISLYLFDASTWNGIESQTDKDNLFNDITDNPNNYKNNKIDAYKGILANKENATYNEVLAILNENTNGENLLLYINNSFSEEYHGERHVTVHGKLK